MKYSNKTILVTGGAGFIGSALTRRLLEENSRVVVLDDFSTGKLENVPLQCEIIKGEVADSTSFNKLADVDYILHFGAPSSVVLFNDAPEKCMTDTIIGLRNVFEFSRKACVKKVVFPSSSSVYGNIPLPQSETSSTLPTNLYGVAKLTCEYISMLYSDLVKSVGLRIFAGYGSGESHKGKIASVITLFLKAVKENSQPVIFGDGTQSRDFVYIDDIVDAALAALENDFTGIVNVGSGESHTFVETIELINCLLGKKVLPCYVDKPIQYFEHTRADTSLLKDKLGLSPTSLRDGLKKYVDTVKRS